MHAPAVIRGYYLGCPGWGLKSWVGRLFPPGTRSTELLEHAETRARKPNLPVIARATADRPFVRCVPHETFAESRAIAEGWADQVAAWIRSGKTPYVFLHAPDDTYAPENAYDFHAMVRARVDAGELPHRPGAPRQQSLF